MSVSLSMGVSGSVSVTATVTVGYTKQLLNSRRVGLRLVCTQRRGYGGPYLRVCDRQPSHAARQGNQVLLELQP